MALCGPVLAVDTIGTIVRLDPRFEELIPAEAVIEKLAEGFEWSEGPVWNRQGKFLLFSDIPNNRVVRWSEADGISVYLQPAGYTGATPRGGEPGSNGLLFDASGRLVLCQHGDRRIARLIPPNRFETIVDQYQGRRLNSPNDAVFHSSGALYFTDPPYGLLGLNNDPAKELDFNGVYRLSPDGQLMLLTKEMSFPNGITLSPDEQTLYVANSDPKLAIWKAFDVQSDGSIANGRVLADVTNEVDKRKGLPDGMKADARGNLFATGPGGVWVFAADGKPLGRIDTGEATANCGWGDDGSTLYITADMYLCRVKTKTKGRGF
jgi:gluconolactonase